MDLLAVGALIAILWRNRQHVIKRFGHYGLIFSALALLTLAALSRRPGFTTTANTPQTNLWIYELSLIACTGAILWALSGKRNGELTLSPVRYIGRISYTIYLIHFTVLILVSQYLQEAGRLPALLSPEPFCTRQSPGSCSKSPSSRPPEEVTFPRVPRQGLLRSNASFWLI